MIDYKIIEDSIEGYETIISGYDITNIYKYNPDYPVFATGDSFNPVLLFVIMVVSFVSLIGLVLYRYQIQRKMNQKKQD